MNDLISQPQPTRDSVSLPSLPIAAVNVVAKTSIGTSLGHLVQKMLSTNRFYFIVEKQKHHYSSHNECDNENSSSTSALCCFVPFSDMTHLYGRFTTKQIFPGGASLSFSFNLAVEIIISFEKVYKVDVR